MPRHSVIPGDQSQSNRLANLGDLHLSSEGTVLQSVVKTTMCDTVLILSESTAPGISRHLTTGSRNIAFILDELLSHILVLSATPEPDVNTKDFSFSSREEWTRRVELTTVCKLWRSVAKACPEFS